MNPGYRVGDQLNTSEPTAPYIIGRELNLRKLFGGVVHDNACTKLFIHMLKYWSGYRFNNVVFYRIILHFSDIL